MSEKFTFFWDGIYSQWFMRSFVVDKVKYNCAEQYMMAEKARLFKDKAAEKAIMKSRSPYEQKMLGRKVKRFNVDKWNNVARDIVYRGNMAKFGQNKDLLERLFSTEGTTLVESSPVDTIWGIGLAEDNPKARNRSTWNGKNWLGEVLTRVREDLKDQHSSNI